MITHEGTRINISIESLQEGEGFVVDFKTSNSGMPRQAQQIAHKEGLFGRRLRSHEETFTLAKDSIANEIDAFTGELTTFISKYNNGDYE